MSSTVLMILIYLVIGYLFANYVLDKMNDLKNKDKELEEYSYEIRMMNEIPSLRNVIVVMLTIFWVPMLVFSIFAKIEKLITGDK